MSAQVINIPLIKQALLRVLGGCARTAAPNQANYLTHFVMHENMVMGFGNRDWDNLDSTLPKASIRKQQANLLSFFLEPKKISWEAAHR